MAISPPTKTQATMAATCASVFSVSLSEIALQQAVKNNCHPCFELLADPA